MPHDPVVFISSTSTDLTDYREQAARAATASGFSPRMMEYFPASGHKPSLQVCLDMVAHAEVVVVIVAGPYTNVFCQLPRQLGVPEPEVGP